MISAAPSTHVSVDKSGVAWIDGTKVKVVEAPKPRVDDRSVTARRGIIFFMVEFGFALIEESGKLIRLPRIVM